MTIKELYLACKEQIMKGNGDKIIYISKDDEGNEFHKLYYLFTENTEDFENEIYNNYEPLENIILLG